MHVFTTERTIYEPRVITALELNNLFITMVLIGLLSVLIPSCSILAHAESVLKKAGSEYLFKHVPSPPISYLKVKKNYTITISNTPTSLHYLQLNKKLKKGRATNHTCQA
jgi:hypothetical protein